MAAAAPRLALAAPDWLLDAWRVEEGLPDNVVDAITQTPDGYLWLGTQGGLAQFDGVRFTVIDDPRLKIERVRQLYVDHSGRLWVLGEQGDVAFIHEGEVRTFTAADGAPSSGLQTPTEDSEGRMWFSACEEEGCFRFDGTRFVNIFPTNAPSPGNFNVMAFDRDGTLYAGRLGELWKLFPGDPVPVVDRADPQRVPLLCRSRHGGFWFVARNECFFVRDGKWRRVADIPFELPPLAGLPMNFEDTSGRLWLAARVRPRPMSVTTNGLVEEQTFTSRSNLNCRVLFEDREGNRWWSTGTDGLRRFRPRQLKLVSDGVNLFPSAVHAVAADPRQGVWALLGRGVIHITNSLERPFTLLTNRIGFPNTLWVDSDRTVWVGGNRSGLFRLSAERFDRFRDETDKVEPTPVLSVLFRDRQNDLLVGSGHGLFRFSDNKIVRVSEADTAGLLQGDFRALAQDRQGRLYAGLRNDGLWRREAQKWTRIGGMPGDDIAALYCDSDSAVWIAVTGHGLGRLANEKLFLFQPNQVRLPRNIYGIMEDEIGFLWLTSSEGIFRVSRAQLNAVVAGEASNVKVRRFDKSDGMTSTQCTSGQQPVLTRSVDGKMWFATAGGLYVLDPQTLQANELAPPVVVEEVIVDERPVWKRPLNSVRATRDRFEVAPNNTRVEFRFTALSLSAPQRNRFRFQLAGLNPDWIEADAQRLATYTRVPPGRYQFKVMASNNDGVWNESGASLAVTVFPYWWQTIWFRTLVAVGGGLLLFAAYRARIRILERDRLRQQEFSRRLLESQEQERRRIAGELHDSLGQNLLVVKNYAVLALKETTTPEKMREQLREISESTTTSIEEVRSLSRALRPYQLDRFGLTKTLEDAAELMGKSGSLRVETKIDNVDGIFSSEAEISIYRIVQEWLSNVSKHAQASVARLTVQKVPGLVRLILEDDGAGFDYTAVINRSGKNAGFGLANLRERLRLLGGTLLIESAPGKGTRLVAEIPLEK